MYPPGLEPAITAYEQEKESHVPAGIETRNHSIRTRERVMYPPGLEPAIPAYERPQTDVLDRAATRIDMTFGRQILFMGFFFWCLRKKTVALKITETCF
jgi:hypothetical protein